jgi:hypothetical protein
MWHPFSFLPRSWRIPVLVVLFALTLLVAAKTNQPLYAFPMSALELAPNKDAAEIIIDCWKGVDPELKAARLLQYWDNYFILCYSTFLALGCFIITDWLYSSEARANLLGKLLAWLMWAVAILDYVENYAINQMLRGRIESPWPKTSSISASLKFALIGAGITFIVTSLVVRLLLRNAPRVGSIGNRHNA